MQVPQHRALGLQGNGTCITETNGENNLAENIDSRALRRIPDEKAISLAIR